ncbi:MAG: hypothetical protein NT069_07145 [Planctomycetota bacterium]|nr:hypothetical protein [Planctomycetota bacterium]
MTDEPTPLPKISDRIAEMAAGFLLVGESLIERQNRLNTACTAWNFACLNRKERKHQLEKYPELYLKQCPGESREKIANIIKDIEILIERKRKLFPDDNRTVVKARVVRIDTGFRIEVTSTSVD